MIYFAAYYTNNHDNHKNVKLEPNDFEYIKNYYLSIRKKKLPCIILHDNLSEEFINKYQTKSVKFVKCETNQKYQPHDARFFHLYNFSRNNEKIKYACMTDISDVIVINDCSQLSKNDKIFIGAENGDILENAWFADYLSYINLTCDFDKTKFEIFESRLILNSGIICGNRKLLLIFLKKCVEMMNNMETIRDKKNLRNNRPLDMFVINYVSYYYFPEYVCIHPDLNTPFGHNIYDPKCYFKNK